MAYIITMVVLLVFYALAVYLMKYLTNRKLANILFALSVFLPYICHSLYILSQDGFGDWNFQNTLPVANVSPFMFTSMLYLLFLPKKLRKYVFLLISLLQGVAMGGGVLIAKYYGAKDRKTCIFPSIRVLPSVLRAAC